MRFRKYLLVASELLLIQLVFIPLHWVTCSLTPAHFIFGDSLVDPGNNNYLRTSLAKANYPYNGIDFKGGATGRFCNGRTVIDVISELVGLPYSPPYLAPSTKGAAILQGVSYASGAGGILDSTGFNYIQRLGMNQQISYFRNTRAQLDSILGPAGAIDFLGKSLFSIVLGSNDFINNYLFSASTIRFQYTPKQYNLLLVNTFAQQLTSLYDLGGRKFMVAAVGPIGCIPDQTSKTGNPQCVSSTNDQIEDYNSNLKLMLQSLNSRLQGATFLYANVYDIFDQLIVNPGMHGFTNVDEGCCGAGLFRGQIPCIPQVALCSNRNEYLFWDPFHPTEAANVVLANRLFSGGPEDVQPVNIRQLIEQN